MKRIDFSWLLKNLIAHKGVTKFASNNTNSPQEFKQKRPPFLEGGARFVGRFLLISEHCILLGVKVNHKHFHS